MITQADMTEEAINRKNAAIDRFEKINSKIVNLLKKKEPLFVNAFRASGYHFKRFAKKEGVMAQLEFKGGSMAHQIGCIRQTILMEDRCTVLEIMLNKLRG